MYEYPNTSEAAILSVSDQHGWYMQDFVILALF